MVSLLGSAPVEEATSRFLGGDLVIRHEPIGVIAGIVPWNYPQTLSAFKYAPALGSTNQPASSPAGRPPPATSRDGPNALLGLPE
jgi:aldehyde dehydrogenase (NAD+)